MIRRRDVLKVAAAAGFATAPVLSITRAQAAAALDEPAATPPPSDTTVSGADGVKFADDIFRGSLWSHSIVHEAAEDYAEYYKAFDVLQRLPALEGADGNHPLYQAHDAAMSLASSCFLEGLRAGVAAEQFRRVIIGPTKTCIPCQGTGLDRSDRVCTRCLGHGTVPIALGQEDDAA